MQVAGGSSDEWEDVVVTYCLSLSVQFGFQTFAPRKAPSGLAADTKWYPSTAFIATHTLTAALQDVASRTKLTAAADTPQALAGLACAVRDLHCTIFQPYMTWLKATRLRPVNRPAQPVPNHGSLHFELADLALYWLVYSEAANLRHTPDMIWFIFYCAQRSWQAKQVLSHLRLHEAELAALPHQPWLEAQGPGMARAVQTLHAQYRHSQSRASGKSFGSGGLLQEATLTLPPDMKPPQSGAMPSFGATVTVNAAVGPTEELLYSSTAAAVRSAHRVTVLADGSISMPYNPSDKGAGCDLEERRSPTCHGSGSAEDQDGSRSNSSSRTDDARAGRDNAGDSGSGARVGRTRFSPESPSLPFPPALSIPVSSSSRNATNPPPASQAAGSVFAAPSAAEGLVAAVAAPTPALAPQHLGLMASTPMSPAWDPRAPVRDYRELLLRFCPNEAAVAAVLSVGDGSNDGKDGGGKGCSTPFLNRVVQPLFLFLTEQIFELGQARRQGLESAVRISYDDVSESMAHPDVVAAALAALPWATTTASVFVETGVKQRRGSQLHGLVGGVMQPAAASAGQRTAGHLQGPQQQQQVMPRAAAHDEELYWSRLLALSDLPSAGAARIPWQGDMAHYRPQLLRLLHGGGEDSSGGAGGAAQGRPAGRSRPSARGMNGDDKDGDEEAPNHAMEQVAQEAGTTAAQSVSPEAASELGSLRRANAAADWWARHVLRKTFVEHRSLAMPLIAFARVYQFQLIWFYLLCVWSWANSDNMMHWIASAAALHWGSCCLLWTMQAVLSAGARMKRTGAVIPFYASSLGRPHRGYGPAAPSDSRGFFWWIVQIYMLLLCWGALGVGLYIAYIVWPNHDFYGYQCYPLYWGHSCYWWIAVVYGGLLLMYELLYRQCNLGGYARSHIFDAILRLIPGGGTSLASSSSSPMYDPTVHLRTGLSYLLGNAALWGSALAMKFVMDYFVIVRPAGPRLREVMALNKLAWSFYIRWSWWPEGWARRFRVDIDPCLAAAQVIVLFLLSLVSSGVAYSVACAILSTLQGVRQGLGSIRNWGHIRAGFHRVQAAMRAKLLSTDDARVPDNRSWVVRAVGAFFRAIRTVLCLPYTWVVALLRWSRFLPRPADDRPKSWEQREETLAITAPFWNAVVRSMRGRDLLSDREVASLSFSAVSLSPASLMMATWRRGGSTAAAAAGAANGRYTKDARLPRETYLPPVAVYVAQIPHLVISGSSASSEQLEVLQEAYLYLLHLLVAVGAIPRSAAAAEKELRRLFGDNTPAAVAAAAAAFCSDLHKNNFHPEMFASMPARAPSHRHMRARKELLGTVVALVRALLEAGKVYKDTAGAIQAGGGVGSSAAAAATTATNNRSRAIDKLCMALHAVARSMTQMHDLPWNVTVIVNRVVSRQHYHQQPVKAMLDRGFSALVNPNRNNATTWGAEHVPSYEDFAKVSSWLLAILRPSDEGTAPTNSEALVLLADFCAGMVHPGLPTAPRVDLMRSVTTLIPHYQETVLYALSSADARRVLEAAGAGSLEGNLAEDEVLFKNDEGAPSELLQYLVSEFPDEFRNLLERCRTFVPLAKEDPPYVLDDFLPYGRLYEHRAQLLLWASFRGQVLARTVDGMSMYRTALAMQAVHDAMTAGEGGRCGGSRQRGGGNGGEDEGPEGRLVLSGVQRMMVRGILRDTSLCVEEMVAQLVDVAPGLAPLLERKYSLVVSSQVFAKMAAARSLADRWRAHGISLLATRYPALRVSYLEQEDEALTLFKAPDFTYRVVHQASVLVRAVPLEREAELRRQARAEREAAMATSANATGYGTQYDITAAAGANATPRSVTGTPSSWPDACSVLDENGSEDGAAGDGDEVDVGVMLRLWRRRHQLRDLKAAELEVMFRQQLPVNYYDTNASGVGVILGEGKPENQNSAIPYCPGVLLQTIDMNQDNSLAQAFKLRNATREFEPLGRGLQKQQVAVLGYPEWIFSYRCGLLADLAAATERTFGTQIQRVMAYPSAVRSHYGHPDLWNRLFSMTRGGVSKSNAVQHVSEDVFGGYNAIKRGGISKYVSYISVGKGRDMGLDSILGFEGKISKGCAEQLMSRDLRFLGNHTDFFRSMSLYFTVPGHFINTWLTVLTIQLGVWVQLLLLLGGVGKAGGSTASAMGAVQILQLGTMPMLGYIFNLWLESGLSAALATLARQFVAGGLLFHIFRSTTSAFHLGRAVLFGGASYVATGRGFSLRRKTFIQVYVNYGRSHLYMGADILLMVVLILVAGNNGGNALPIPAAAMWSPLLVAAALLAGPFWFTPFFFRLNQVLRDTREFHAWLTGSAARGVAEGWAEWNASQLATLRDDSCSQISKYRFWSTAAIVVPRAAMASLSAIVAVTGARFDALGVPDMLWVLGGSVVAWSLLALKAITRRAYLSSGLAQHWRWAKGFVQVLVMTLGAMLTAICLFMPKKGLRFSGVLITLYANYQVASLLVCICVVWFPKTMLARSLSNAAYRQIDATLGTALSAALIIICFVGEIGLVMVDKVQTLVQFNDRYSHTQAARPYAGDDDAAAAAATVVGGSAGGAGLAAAAMAALRRRLPSHTLALAPLNASMGGAGGAGAGGTALQPLMNSGPPSAVCRPIQGWVSPRCRAGGSTTPILMFGNNQSNGGAFATYSGQGGGGGGGVASSVVTAAGPESPLPPKAAASPATPSSSTASTAIVDPPGYLQSPPPAPQRQVSAASRSADNGSGNGDTFASPAAFASAAAIAAAAAAAAGGGGGADRGGNGAASVVATATSGGVQASQKTSSQKELSWSSSVMSLPERQGMAQGSESRSATSGGGSAVPPLADGPPVRSRLTPVPSAKMRLPPMDSTWRQVASTAAAETAASLNSITQVPQLQQQQQQPEVPVQPPRPQPPFLEQQNQQHEPEQREQGGQAQQDPVAFGNGRNGPAFAWVPRPPTEPARYGASASNTSSTGSNGSNQTAAAASPDLEGESSTASSRWASDRAAEPTLTRGNKSPTRRRMYPVRPATAEPSVPAHRVPERAYSGLAATTAGDVGRRSSATGGGGESSDGGCSAAVNASGNRAAVTLEGTSFAAPIAAALANGALSGWVGPRSMRLDAVTRGARGSADGGGRLSGGGAL